MKSRVCESAREGKRPSNNNYNIITRENKMELVYRNYNITNEDMNKIIDMYKTSNMDTQWILDRVNKNTICEEDMIYDYMVDQDLLLQIIFGHFEAKVNYMVIKKYGILDTDIASSMLYDIVLLMEKPNVHNFYGYIVTSIKWKISKKINLEVFYPSLSINEINDLHKLNGKLADSLESKLTDKEQKRLNYINEKIVKHSNLDGFVGEDGETTLGDMIADPNAQLPFEYLEEEPEYRYKDTLDVLTEDERELIDLKYGRKLTHNAVAHLLGCSEKTVRNRLKKVVNKIEL